ncbi:uncharacterized protein LOC125025916 [Penaeus chinensis]|uniref:uncharacterized protein LOC125025916 n=1 Tax=Penaeus chinensis TaxID=139456 RepID=UPI001FB75BBD|nr:uncharacterized protein LOC125025916 [Penaeus chinensis]
MTTKEVIFVSLALQVFLILSSEAFSDIDKLQLMEAKMHSKGPLCNIPLSPETFEELNNGPFPGDKEGDLFREVPYKSWYCFGLCDCIHRFCDNEGKGQPRCDWCAANCYEEVITADPDYDY